MSLSSHIDGIIFVMSGTLVIRSKEEGVKKISVINSKTDLEDKRKQILILIFWLTVLLSGLYFLADLTNNFTDIPPAISHFTA